MQAEEERSAKHGMCIPRNDGLMLLSDRASSKSIEEPAEEAVTQEWCLKPSVVQLEQRSLDSLLGIAF